MAEPTATLAAVTTELRRRMGPIGSKGIYNCRCFRINGVLRCDKGYSQHSWANAEDLDVYGKEKQKPYVDELKRMKSQGYPVGTIIWAGTRSDHTDHIHLEGSPKMTGTPPCKGGKEPDTVTVDPNLPKGEAGGNVSVPVSDDAPEVNIPLVGDIGPVLYRGMWLVVGLGAVIFVVILVAKGLGEKVAQSETGQAVIGAAVGKKVPG